MQNIRTTLNVDALHVMLTIARTGSMAAAARELGQVPSALSYRVRKIEESLDVLLFDRRSRQAELTAAGHELIREATRMLQEMDAIAARVKRVASGWEAQFTIAADSLISRTALLDLCEQFFALRVPTRLRIRTEVLSGTVESLLSGQADLALAMLNESDSALGLHSQALGDIGFVFAVAPNHPLVRAQQPISDATLQTHRVVAVSDSSQRGAGWSVGLLNGQEVFSVSDGEAKLQAQLRGLGCGFLPEPIARAHLKKGSLRALRLERPARVAHMRYVWRAVAQAPMHKRANSTHPNQNVPAHTASAAQGLALQWWLKQLQKSATRKALLQVV